MPSKQILQLKVNLCKDLPNKLVDELINSYEEITENYYFGKYEPLELNAAKLCEVTYRILEFEIKKNFTPLGKQIRNIIQKLRDLEKESSMNDSIRFHIPRVAISIYNIRNKRGVGHIGGDIDPNFSDSTYVACAVDWILAELIRLHYHCDLEEAQKIVTSLVQRKIPLIYEIEVEECPNAFDT